MDRIAITGSTGIIGRRLCEALAGEFEVIGIDRAGAQFTIDITDRDALSRAFEGCGTVVHLAAASALTASWEEVQQNNIEGTFNVFETARLAGCKRIIYASSHHVVGMYRSRASWESEQSGAPLTVDLPPRPDSLYAVSKVFGEALGRYYSDAFGIQVACIRIGAMNEADKPLPSHPRLPWRRDRQAERRQAAKWFSHNDFARLVRTIVRSDVPFAIVYGVSDNKGRFLDLSAGRAIYGYLPEDGAHTDEPRMT